MNVFGVVFQVILMLVDIVLIVLVLMQSGKSAGLSGSIAGGAETFFGKQKAKSFEGRLAFLTKVAAVVFFALSIGLALVQRFVGA